MRCFSSSKKQRKFLMIDSPSPTASPSSSRISSGSGSTIASRSSKSSKMTRTRSAPPSFLAASCSPLARVSKHSRSKEPEEAAAAAVSSPSPSCSYSSSSVTLLPNSSNSLVGGVHRESPFRGKPLPLPTPESCGLAPEPPRPFSFPSPARQPAVGAAALPPPTPGRPPPAASATNLPRPPISAPVVCPPPAAHIRFSPDSSCIGEGGNGPAFSCSVLLDSSTTTPNETDALLVRLLDPTMQDPKAWMEELKVMAALRHPNLSRILGYSFTSDEKLVVYESQINGSLDRLLYGRTRSRPPLDWHTRFQIALDAAKGLVYLLEKCPNKLVYKDFRTFNIHVDADFHGKLVGYGFTKRDVDADSVLVAAYASPELISGEGHVSDKCITWSFGVVLLEVLTGRQNRDEMFPPEQQDLVEWTSQYLMDDRKQFLIVDPELKGMYSSKAAAGLASLASQCLQKDAATRPSMQEVLEKLETLKTQEPYPYLVERSSSRGSERKPLIEALRDEGCSPWCSPVQSPSRLAVRPPFSVHGSVQKKLASKLVRTLCTSAVTSE